MKLLIAFLLFISNIFIIPLYADLLPEFQNAIEKGALLEASQILASHPEQLHQFTTIPNDGDYWMVGRANPAVSVSGPSPLALSVQYGFTDLTRLFLEKNAGPNATHIRITDQFQRFEGEGVNGRLRFHILANVETALSLAIEMKDLEMVELLIKHGAVLFPARQKIDVFSQNVYGGRNGGYTSLERTAIFTNRPFNLHVMSL